MICRAVVRILRVAVGAALPRHDEDGGRMAIFVVAGTVVHRLPSAAMRGIERLRLPFWSEMARADRMLRSGEIFEYGVAMGIGGPRVVLHPSVARLVDS